MGDVSVSFHRNHYLNILSSLELLSPDVPEDGRVLLVADVMHGGDPPLSLSSESIKAVVDYIKRRSDAQIYLVANSFRKNTAIVISNLGYRYLGIPIIDPANFRDYSRFVYVDEENREAATVDYISTESWDYIISLVQGRTDIKSCLHLTIKNMMSLIKPDPRFVNSFFSLNDLPDFRIHAENIARFYEYVRIDLSVIDAHRFLEGDAPDRGNIRDMYMVIAGEGGLPICWAFCYIVGIDPYQIPHYDIVRKRQREDHSYRLISPDVGVTPIKPPKGFSHVVLSEK